MNPAVQPDLVLHESCGLEHERQIAAVNFPASGGVVSFRDAKTGRKFPAQASRENPAVAFLQLELRAEEELWLVAQEGAGVVVEPVARSGSVVSNGRWAAEVFIGEWKADGESAAPTPVRRVRVKEGAWRGNFFFDSRYPFQAVRGTVVESGPLRVVVFYEARAGSEHFYTARLTFDAGTDFVAIEEQFHGESGDQIVWDFAGADLPERIHLLDSTAGFTSQELHYFFDRRVARLACWNQYSQLHDFSDGYALKFSGSEDVLGLVALRGGDWDGNSHNYLEAWTRRWLPGDPGSRRLVPPEAKADAAPSPERIAARPANKCEEHFSVEGWLYRGRRSFALVLTSESALRSPEWNLAPPLGHFEDKPDRARYRQQQSLLRRIHTQRGLFSLEDQLAMTWSWPVEKAPACTLGDKAPWEHRDPLSFVPPKDYSLEERREQIWDFLSARVFGFWEGSGSAYTNAVVNRRLADDLVAWEWLTAHGHLSPEQLRLGRARYAFLCHLLSSDHYYPGPASMGMGADTKSLEPAMAGMANQNFFTDVYNFPGIAAQIFHAHPEATHWREQFTLMWRRQMEYHVYPESGVWEESHTYFHHVLQTLWPTFVRRRDEGVEDAFADTTFRHAAASLLKLLTPRDACFGGKRHVVTLGDHSVDLNDLYRPLYRLAAQEFAPFDAELAAHFAWAYREQDGEEPLAVEPRPVPWRNEYVQGLGYFFRDRDPRGESLIVLRCGSSWAHHHADDGSLQFFYGGRAWIVDSAFSFPQVKGVRKFRADGHSRWSPRQIDPLNHFWQFNRGWIMQRRDESPFPYAIAHTPIYMAEGGPHYYLPLRRPILHRRGVFQLTPAAFLVFDYTDQVIPQATRFHVPADAALALEENAWPAGAQGLGLRLCSLFGLHAPEAQTLDRPTQAPESYTTREVCYAWRDLLLTAILVSVESADKPSQIQIQREGSSLDLRGAGFAIALDVSRPTRVVLRDIVTGREFALALGE